MARPRIAAPEENIWDTGLPFGVFTPEQPTYPGAQALAEQFVAEYHTAASTGVVPIQPDPLPPLIIEGDPLASDDPDFTLPPQVAPPQPADAPVDAPSAPRDIDVLPGPYVPGVPQDVVPPGIYPGDDYNRPPDTIPGGPRFDPGEDPPIRIGPPSEPFFTPELPGDVLPPPVFGGGIMAILPREQTFGPPPFAPEEFIPQGSGMPDAGPSRRPGESLIPSMRRPPVIIEENQFEELLRRKPDYIPDPEPRMPRGVPDDLLTRAVGGAATGGSIIIGEVLKEALKVLTRRRREPGLRPGPGGFSPPRPPGAFEEPVRARYPERPVPTPLPMPPPINTEPLPSPTFPFPAPSSLPSPSSLPQPSPGPMPSSTGGTTTRASVSALQLLPFVLPLLRSQNVTPRPSLERLVDLSPSPGDAGMPAPGENPVPVPTVPGNPNPAAGPVLSDPFGQPGPLTGLKTQPLRSRDDCPPCRCTKTKRGKRRKCLSRADVVWAGGPKKGQKAGSRCTSFSTTR